MRPGAVSGVDRGDVFVATAVTVIAVSPVFLVSAQAVQIGEELSSGNPVE